MIELVKRCGSIRELLRVVGKPYPSSESRVRVQLLARQSDSSTPFPCVYNIRTDVDKCRREEHSCDWENVACTNTEGSFICICNPGWHGDGLGTDMDECILEAHNTDAAHGLCTNSHGSFSCSCGTGFWSPNQPEGVECFNVLECEASHDCYVTALCKATHGVLSALAFLDGWYMMQEQLALVRSSPLAIGVW